MLVGTTKELAVALATFAGFVLLAYLLKYLLGPLVFRITRRTKNELDEKLVEALRGPLVLVVVVIGIYVALCQVSALGPYMKTIDKTFLALGTVVGVFALLRAFHAAVDWYIKMVTERTGQPVGYHANLIRRLVTLIVLVMALVMVLDQLGYKITPLITSLGLAGLAIALALQDTLTNFFSGLYLMLDRPIKVGDFVKLDTGDEGFVEEVGWRSTKIRLWANNLVVIPNAKLSQSVITNYFMPVTEMSVYVWCGVSYDSDLEQVDRVAIEVAKETMAQVEGSATDWEPVVRFKEFGESNITFVVVLRVKDVTAQYLLTHEYIKALHKRFREEEIEINYPVRKLVLPEGQSAVPQIPTPPQPPQES